MKTSAVDALATASARVRWSALDPPAREHAGAVFLDTLAVMAGGLTSPVHRNLQRLLIAPSAAGPATVLGRSGSASVADAVAFHGSLPTVLQLDEGFRASKGHPGIHIVPVVLAVGEQQGSSLDDVLSALIAGYEVAARIGVAMGGTQPDIHPHGNWGAVGAAVAAAWLYSAQDPIAIATAIDIAAGIAGRHDRRGAALGAGVHHLWASVGAHTGLLAGIAASAGASAVGGALEDFLLARSGLRPQAELLTAGLSEGRFTDLAITANYFKLWAACGHTHTAIGAALALRRDPTLEVAEISEMEVRTFAAAATLSARTAPNALAARFSIPFVVAAALTHGEFRDDVVADDALAQLEPLAQRVRVIHDPDMDQGYPAHGRPLRLEARMTDGSTRVVETLLSEGDAERPASAERLEDKALRLFASAFGDAGARSVLSAFSGLTPQTPISIFGSALRQAAQEEERS